MHLNMLYPLFQKVRHSFHCVQKAKCSFSLKIHIIHDPGTLWVASEFKLRQAFLFSSEMQE